MPIGESVKEDDPPKRGCLFKLAVGFGFLALLGAIGSRFDSATNRSLGSSGQPARAALVEPYPPLTEQQKTQALRKMTKETDQVEGTAFYYDRATNHGLGHNAFFAYIGKDDKALWLRLTIMYSGEDWIFFNHMTIVADGIKVEFAGLNPQRKVGAGYVTEWMDSPVTARDYALLTAVGSAKKAVIRLEGDQVRYDRTISGQEKTAIQNVVMAYRALGATSPPS